MLTVKNNILFTGQVATFIISIILITLGILGNNHVANNYSHLVIAIFFFLIYLSKKNKRWNYSYLICSFLQVIMFGMTLLD